MRALLVVNPQATATTPAGRDVLAHALASAVKLDVLETDYRGHAADAAREAAADRFDLVVAHGGDGTVNEVVNGLLADGVRDEAPMLGVVPGGSANVFARALGLPRDPVEATHHLLRAVEERTSRRVGLGRVSGEDEQPDRWFTFNAGLGWDADVVARMETLRARGRAATPFRYARIAVTSYFRLDQKHPRLTIELPGAEPVDGVHLAFVSNTDPWTYLATRAMHLNPGCSFDGGLGLFALRSLRMHTVLRHVAQVFRNSEPRGRNLVRDDDVGTIRVTCARPVRLQVDGDHLGERSAVEFSAAPAALRVAV
ncbi:diacylglycerol/lipid kinase family protein [Streptoalloteichus hindustanus]|uniref:Diacylglycerol kinase family enzyme n=1 Tax=Streptoalloteichus hindustanus TaxID=2017 RepID=A0A1M5JXZ7_STRHI|nr:diacylglycerol kinase family protein [Streptoalloteichus hindustanus]SHG45452.1 Diacylglycerol kinase family enzyme [Streptoalloteichus hindustanus]